MVFFRSPGQKSNNQKQSIGFYEKVIHIHLTVCLLSRLNRLAIQLINTYRVVKDLMTNDPVIQLYYSRFIIAQIHDSISAKMPGEDTAVMIGKLVGKQY